MGTCAFAEVTCVFSTLPPLQTGFLAFSMIWGEGCRHGFFFENPATRWRTLLPRRFPSQTVWVIPSHAPWMLGWNLGFLEDFFGAVHCPPSTMCLSFCCWKPPGWAPWTLRTPFGRLWCPNFGPSASEFQAEALVQCLEQDYTGMTYIYIYVYIHPKLPL